MTNFEIIAIVNAYEDRKAKGTTLTLPAAIAWTRRLNLDKLYRAKSIIDEAMREIMTQYSDDTHSTEENGQRKVRPEYIAEFAKEQAEILSQETDVAIKKIHIEDLGEINLSDSDMDTLAFMLEEEA